MKTAKIVLSVDISQLEQGLRKAGVQFENFAKTVNTGGGRSVRGSGGGGVLPAPPNQPNQPNQPPRPRPMRDVHGYASTIRRGGSNLANLAANTATEGPMGGMSAILGMLGLGAVGAGINSLFQRRLQQAKEDTAIRGLTGSTVSGTSSLGFLQAERRAIGLQIGRAMGRGMSGAELTGAVDSGEMLQNAFNVSGDQQAGFMSAARKGGDANAMRTMIQTVATATSEGLEKARVPELLEAATGLLSEMSANSDTSASAVGRFMSGLIGAGDFFKNPHRAAGAIRGISNAFSSGDKYQQSVAYQAIMSRNPNLSPAAAELVRDRGLFAPAMNAKTLKKLGYDESSISALTQDPTERAKDFLAAGRRNSNRQTAVQNTQVFASLFGLKADDATEIELALKEGRELTPKEKKSLEGKNPATQADQTMMNLNAKIDSMITALSDKVANPITSLTTEVVKVTQILATMSGMSPAAVAAAGLPMPPIRGGKTFDPNADWMDVMMEVFKRIAGSSEKTASNTSGPKLPPGARNSVSKKKIGKN